MPYDELIKWTTFFRRKPVGWDADHRTFLLLKAWGAKGKAEEYFPSLKQIKVAEEESKSRTAGKIAPSGRFLELMKNAKDGDNLTNRPWETKNG